MSSPNNTTIPLGTPTTNNDVNSNDNKNNKDTLNSSSSSSSSSSTATATSPRSSSSSRFSIRNHTTTTTTTSSSSLPFSSRGINTLQINSARQMHARTIRARQPQTATNIQSSFSSSSTTFQPPKRFLPPSKPSSSSSSSSSSSPLPPPPPSKHVCNNPNNPSCSNCGSIIIPAPVATLPIIDNPSMLINNNEWKISSKKGTILNAQEIDHWITNELSFDTLPEMIFGNNFIKLENLKHNWSLSFNALDSLKMVNTNTEIKDIIKVSYSDKWVDHVNRNSMKNFDWTYSTKYKGTEIFNGENLEKKKLQLDNDVQLPMDKLSRLDKILFFDDMILFEDELADNGISVLNVKIRVMEERLLILSRFFLRVDNVICRIYETRVYVEFNDNLIIREFKEFQDDYKNILDKAIRQSMNKKSTYKDSKAAMRDSNWVVQNMPLINRECESLRL
ncbi:Tip41p NDAI_0A01250 [Naumovozyma dairenensis CBS 421]|uniref:Type 2A phosphatase activator TIP41 n=1 Tax=Naumovozyma dairenensis (strain ATCC 10597 / BCRC 20456 / CBS 421 / NBRC 0211 / NRRL Y-12639) TaxID=1071378 RepID=G0W395_NAUDC|nr:hypothetical protein NDAI_0A01250 [Naumovozyma dairenensis CBS 421]CCD22283.1 hypothetical protein NDAI_0A01250 [Naumovozyma dairenensis CBS 421]